MAVVRVKFLPRRIPYVKIMSPFRYAVKCSLCGPNRVCNEVRRRAGQEASSALPCLNLRSFGSKCTVLKNTCCIVGNFRRLGNCTPLPPSRCAHGPNILPTALLKISLVGHVLPFFNLGWWLQRNAAAVLLFLKQSHNDI